MQPMIFTVCQHSSVIYKPNFQQTGLLWRPVWSGLVPPPARPCRTSADLSLDHSGSVFTSISGRLIPCVLLGSQPSSRGRRTARQDRQLRTTPTQTFSPAAGPGWTGLWTSELTTAQRCPVPSVLVVHTLCYILVLYKWWSLCGASTPPQDHLMSGASTVGRNIPEVLRKTFRPPNFSRDVWEWRCWLKNWNRHSLFNPNMIFFSNTRVKCCLLISRKLKKKGKLHWKEVELFQSNQQHYFLIYQK